MKNQAINYVNFNGEPIPTVMHKGLPHVGMKAICEQIGLQWQAQYNRIKRDELLNSVVSMMDITGKDGKTYQMVVLPLKMLNGWLFGIDTARVKNDIKQTILDYQQECYEVLFNYWNGNISKQDGGNNRKHELRLKLLKELERATSPAIRQSIYQQLIEVSAELNMSVPPLTEIGETPMDKRTFVALVNATNSVKNAPRRQALEQIIDDELEAMGYVVKDPQQNLAI